AQEATSYTIRHQAVEFNYDPNDGNDHSPLDYYKYVTEDVIFFNLRNWEYGYAVINDHVYPFTYTPAQMDSNGNVVEKSHVTTDDALNISGIEALQATFELNCAAALFEYKGDNTFVLNNGALYASYILPAFGEGTDEPRQYEYATSMTVILDGDGRLSVVKFKYTTYGISEEVTLTYDFDSEIDLSYLDFESADHHSVLDPFIGEYKDDIGNYAIVDIYGFTINGIQAEVVAYSKDDGMFTAKWNEQTIYISKFSQRQLLIVNDSYTIFWTLNSIYNSTVTIPDQFKGHWYRFDGEYNEKFDFVIQSHAIYFNGELLELLSYTVSEGITATDGENTYNFDLDRDEDGTTLLYVFILYAEDGTFARM
ncbi:MAG: hypothetical protein K2M36_01285, partial [Clostridia bacterium]|nr:hypothetical protein [Clostridia bacterium]